MNDIFAYRKEYKLNKGYSVEFSLDGTGVMASLQAAWSPKVPPEKIVKGKFLESYRSARNDFIGSIGLNTMLVEI